jgi:XRE family transcriptional regulator, stress-response regulator
MVLLRHLLGDALRRLRLRQGRTLREVSASARVSLGYLSEVERGQKEASSELLAAICTALGTPLSQVLREVSDNFALAELQSEPVFADVIEPAIEVTNGAHAPQRDDAPGQVPVGPVASATRVGAAVGAGVGGSVGTSVGASVGANASAKLAVRGGQLRPAQVPVGHVPVAQTVSVAAGPGLPIGASLDAPVFDQVARVARQITDMVPV